MAQPATFINELNTEFTRWLQVTQSSAYMELHLPIRTVSHIVFCSDINYSTQKILHISQNIYSGGEGCNANVYETLEVEARWP